LGLDRIEGVKHEVAAFGDDADGHKGGDEGGGQQVCAGYAEHVAKEDVIQMHIGADLGVEHETEAEHAREHDAHDRVLLDAAMLRQKASGEGAEHTGAKRPDDERDVEDIGEDDAGQNRVADRIPHQGPAFEHQVAGEQRRGYGDDRHDQKRIVHESELERKEQRFDHGALSAAAARRRAAK